MKINSIHIISFGKIKNLKLDFSDNLNIIYGDNEAGKTHIAEFIKMMFYGSGSRGTGVNNLRKKYKPWDNSKMGGIIDFISNGTHYRLEREFKASNSSDTVTLHNLDLGTTQNLSGSDNIGTSIFGISVGAFEQSVFIDNSVVFSGSDGELNLKLSNLSNSTDEDISFEKLLKNISSARESLISKNRKNGPIPELEAEIEKLKCAKQNALGIYNIAEEKAREITDLESKFIASTTEKNQLFEKLKTFEQISLRQKLIEFKTAVEIYNDIEKSLTFEDGTVADSVYLENTQKALQNLKSKNDIIQAKKAEADRFSQEISELSDSPNLDNILSTLKTQKTELTEKLSKSEAAISSLTAKKVLSEQTRSSKKANPTLIILGIILTALGVFAGVIYPYLFPFAAIGIIFISLAFATKSNKNQSNSSLDSIKNDLNAAIIQKEHIKAEIENLDNEINAVIIKNGTDNSLLLSKKEQAIKHQTELIRINEEFEKEKAEIFSQISRFKAVFDIPSAEAVLNEIKALLEKLNEAQIRAQMAVSHTGCKSTEDAFKKLESIPENLPEIEDSKEQLQEKFNNALKETTNLSNRIAELSAELKAMTKGVNNPHEFDRQIAECEEKLASMLDFTKCADLATQALEDAYAEVRRSWGGVLQSRALEIFAGLTNNSYNDMIISKDFEINVKKNDDIISHAVEYLSKGTLHQAYFALRLALSEFLCTDKESLPIILDDIFSQYDDIRSQTGFEFLKQYSISNQVLFFTCHKELTKIKDAQLISLN